MICLKILLVRPFPYRAVNYNVQEIGLARSLNRKGHLCDVVFWGGKTESKYYYEYGLGRFFKVYHLKGWAVLKNGLFKNINALAKEYDIIQSGEYDQLQSWLLARCFPDKTVIYHGPYYCDFNRRYNLKSRIFDTIFLNSYKNRKTPFITKSYMAEAFLLAKGLRDVTTIGVGLDLEQLECGKDGAQHEFVRGLRLKENKHFLLYIGRIEPRRNIKFLFEVFKAVLDSTSDALLVMVGEGNHMYEEECFAYAKTLGINNSIIQTGKIEQKYLPSLYRMCHVFLLPTLYEIFGMVLLEAMYFGVPVITSQNGGSDMLIESGVDGIIVKSWNVNSWKQEILNLLRDEELSKKYRKSSTQNVANNFTWDALADQFIRKYTTKKQRYVPCNIK